MKVNTTRSRAKKAMRRTGQKQYRPEQILAFDIIKNCTLTFGMRKLEMEYQPNNLVPLEGTDLTGDRVPTLDIYLQDVNSEHYAIRLNGPYHDELKQERKDFIQKTFLEMQPHKWHVIDFNYTTMQHLFKRNQRKLSPGELLLAYNEVKSIMQRFGIMLRTPRDEIFNKLAEAHCA